VEYNCHTTKNYRKKNCQVSVCKEVKVANRKRDLRINEQAIRCVDVLLLMFTILRKSALEGELKYQITSHKIGNSSTCILYDLTTCTHIYII
jgi:hypothetical protein